MWWLLVLLLVPGVQAAELSGTVYGPDLERIDEVVLFVNSSPEQVFVIENASYQLSLSAGSYRLVFESDEYADEQNVSLPENGSYVRDVVLLPAIGLPDVPDAPDVSDPSEPPDAETAELDRAPRTSEEADRDVWWIVILAGGGLIAFGFFAYRRSNGSHDYDAYERAVIDSLIKHDGRATQKQIRADVPFSEAKASLVIADLEERGIVRKFKRGRGNVVILEDGTVKEAQDALATSGTNDPADPEGDRVALQDDDESDQKGPSGEREERETRRP